MRIWKIRALVVIPIVLGYTEVGCCYCVSSIRILNRQDTVRKNDTQAQSIKQEIGNFVESNTDIFSKVLKC